MPQIKGTNVVAPVVPLDTADVHPSHEARYGKGGYRTVATLAERDAIPAPRREAGMLVYVQADDKIYQLSADLLAWEEFSGGVSTWTELEGKPSTFPPEPHGHTVSAIVGLQAALDGKQASGSYATLVGGKVPESQLPPIVTTWEGLTGKPSTFPPSTHSHVIADVTGLQTAIDGKAASSHTHTISNVTGLQTALDAKATPADVTTAVASVVNAAPASLDTLKELADALGNDANFASTVTNAIAGKAAAVHTHVIGDVTGLQTALDGKQASGSYAASVHTHGISDVTGLQTALDGKQAAGSYAAATHGHSISDVTGLQTALDGKSGVSHTHSALDIQSGTLADARLSANVVLTADTRLASNGNKGDITVSGSGATWTINAGSVVEADLANAVRNMIFHPFLLGGM